MVFGVVARVGSVFALDHFARIPFIWRLYEFQLGWTGLIVMIMAEVEEAIPR